MTGQVRVAIAGKAYTGKSSVARWVAQEYSGRVANIAEPIKVIGDAVADEFDVPRNKRSRRRYYQAVGKGGRNYDLAFWVMVVSAFADRLDDPAVAIDDARYPNELMALHQCGFVVVHLTTSLDVRKARAIERDGTWDEKAMRHETETALDDWGFPDWVLRYQTDTAMDFDGVYADLRSRIDPFAAAAKPVVHPLAA